MSYYIGHDLGVKVHVEPETLMHPRSGVRQVEILAGDKVTKVHRYSCSGNTRSWCVAVEGKGNFVVEREDLTDTAPAKK